MEKYFGKTKLSISRNGKSKKLYEVNIDENRFFISKQSYKRIANGKGPLGKILEKEHNTLTRCLNDCRIPFSELEGFFKRDK